MRNEFYDFYKFLGIAKEATVREIALAVLKKENKIDIDIDVAFTDHIFSYILLIFLNDNYRKSYDSLLGSNSNAMSLDQAIKEAHKIYRESGDYSRVSRILKKISTMVNEVKGEAFLLKLIDNISSGILPDLAVFKTREEYSLEKESAYQKSKQELGRVEEELDYLPLDKIYLGQDGAKCFKEIENEASGTILIELIGRIFQASINLTHLTWTMNDSETIKLATFIANITKAEYRKPSSVKNPDLSFLIVKNAFARATQKGRDEVTIDDFVVSVSNCEHLKEIMRRKFALELFENLYPNEEPKK